MSKIQSGSYVVDVRMRSIYCIIIYFTAAASTRKCSRKTSIEYFYCIAKTRRSRYHTLQYEITSLSQLVRDVLKVCLFSIRRALKIGVPIETLNAIHQCLSYNRLHLDSYLCQTIPCHVFCFRYIPVTGNK